LLGFGARLVSKKKHNDFTLFTLRYLLIAEIAVN